MKKLLFIIILLSIYSLSFSQIDKLIKVEDYLKSGDIINAKKTIDEVFTANSNTNVAKAWMYKGYIYQMIYESDEEKIKNLDKDPLNESYQSFLKAIEYDTRKELLNDIIKSLKIVSNEFVYDGMQNYNAQNYEKAYICFNNSLNINSMSSIMALDTIVIYNTALAAEKSLKFDIAEELFNKLLALKYGGAKIYSDLADLYKTEKKYDMMIKTLNDGIKYYSDDIESKYNLIIKLINYYLETSNYDEIIRYVNMSLAIKPDNCPYLYLLAASYEQKGQLASAEENYKKTIACDSNYVDALYNLGVLYYNEGVDLIKKSMDKTQKTAADAKYSQAMPYFEKVIKINPNDVETKKLLKTVYTILNMQDKADKIQL